MVKMATKMMRTVSRSWQHHLWWRKWLDRTLGGGQVVTMVTWAGSMLSRATPVICQPPLLLCGLVRCCTIWWGVLSTATQWNFPVCTSWECAPVICQHLQQARHQKCNKAATSAALLLLVPTKTLRNRAAPTFQIPCRINSWFDSLLMVK